jgi:hypothetical protein
VEKDIEKEKYHLEEPAIGDHPIARYNLAIEEGRNGMLETQLSPSLQTSDMMIQYNR